MDVTGYISQKDSLRCSYNVASRIQLTSKTLDYINPLVNPLAGHIQEKRGAEHEHASDGECEHKHRHTQRDTHRAHASRDAFNQAPHTHASVTDKKQKDLHVD